ncbi:MAG: outer membrane protein assembly factor BamD [Terriglobia bacterium]
MNFRNPGQTIRKPAVWFSAILLVSVALFPGCLFHRHHQTSGITVAPGEQPDKILLQKSLNEIRHGRYQPGRLLLQALINTYPDSEYLSQAKLAIADSYYKEGGISGLTEAEAEYKDFITFFPTAPEAPMSEYRAGMCHFRLIGKANRDASEALAAQAEFKEFLLKYPTNPLMPEVKGRLREVQEVLAEGEYDIAMFYYVHRAYLAAESRFQDITTKYPNFSQGDEVFWSLGQSLAQLHRTREAVPYYDRLIMEFPLSPYVKLAKAQLASLHAPIPRPTRAMLARAEADAAAARRNRRSLLDKAFGGLSSGPDYSTTLHGPVVLGSQNQIQVQIAKLDKAQPSVTSQGSSSNGVTVQPGSAADLKKNSDPAQPKSPPAAGTPASSSTGVKQQNLSNGADSSTPATPPKKKGKLHFLKKIIP